MPPALAVDVEPAEDNVMTRPPFALEKRIFRRGLVGFVVVIAVAFLSTVGLQAAVVRLPFLQGSSRRLHSVHAASWFHSVSALPCWPSSKLGS